MDSDPIGGPDTFPAIIADQIGGFKYKYYGLFFIIFLFISTDIFIGLLSRISGATELKSPTFYGTCIQGLLLVIALISLEALSELDVL